MKEIFNWNKYRLNNDIPPIETKSFWGYMTSSVNAISIITMFTIIIKQELLQENSLGAQLNYY
ncbi:hypothetical protein KHA80_20910 [Anaerobacillus sp. HL2]|nr:hypothetical protein KHA80_20910 [Anaerobacillus sp. HL2]